MTEPNKYTSMIRIAMFKYIELNTKITDLINLLQDVADVFIDYIYLIIPAYN
nr:hypothetical protein CJLB15_00108 [Campylobacter phage CJLB-15]